MKPAKRFLINGVNRSSGPEVFCIKMNCNTGAFLWVFRNFKNIFLTEHLQVTASAKNHTKSLMCSRANAPYVLTCLHAHVPTCLACLRAHVPTYLLSSRTHVLTCVMYSGDDVSCMQLQKTKKWVFNYMFSLDFW